MKRILLLGLITLSLFVNSFLFSGSGESFFVNLLNNFCKFKQYPKLIKQDNSYRFDTPNTNISETTCMLDVLDSRNGYAKFCFASAYGVVYSHEELDYYRTRSGKILVLVTKTVTKTPETHTLWSTPIESYQYFNNRLMKYNSILSMLNWRAFLKKRISLATKKYIAKYFKKSPIKIKLPRHGLTVITEISFNYDVSYGPNNPPNNLALIKRELKTCFYKKILIKFNSTSGQFYIFKKI